MRFNLLILIAAVFSYGCATSKPTIHSENAKQLSLEKVETLEIARSSPEEIKLLFGEPYKAVQSVEGSTWLYLNAQSTGQKAAFKFTSANTLASIHWIVYDEDAEKNLAVVKRRYPKANFQKRELDWINPHIAPSEVYFQDEKLGISIEVNKYRGGVTSIGWYNPSARTLADAKPKRYKHYRQPGTGLISIVEAAN